VGPYDDEKLGFNKVAKFYYYPGWWEGGPELDLFVNLKAWNDLPKDYQSILEAACYEANVDMLAKYDAVNPPALRRLVAGGTQLRGFSREILQACYKATIEVNEETAAKNEKFKKIYEPWKKFRDEEDLWFSVAENNFDNFMVQATRAQAGTGSTGEEVAAARAGTSVPRRSKSPAVAGLFVDGVRWLLRRRRTARAGAREPP
jgi:TRAP-type mannitol/chloroaromatic compound transport system substrate-binding protein